MAEAIGLISAVNQLLETAISIIRRLRQAYDRQKESAGVFDRHLQEFSSIRTIIQIIQDEDALQTEPVGATLVRLKATEDHLVNFLRRIEPGQKHPLQQFSHQLVHGSKEQKSLESIMTELTRVKTDLFMNIQVAHVGVTRSFGNMVVANSEVIRRIDRRLVQVFGSSGGLKIAQLLKDRSPLRDGSVQLSNADIASLSSEDDLFTDDSESPVPVPMRTRATTERIVKNNTTVSQALMVNGPIGEDRWKNINRLEIKDNRAEDTSTMVNYAMSLDVFEKIMDRHRDRQY